MFWHLPGGTQKIHEKPQLGWQVSCLRFKLRRFQIDIWSIALLNMLLVSRLHSVNGRLTDKPKGIWKEVAVINLWLLPCHLAGGTEEHHKRLVRCQIRWHGETSMSDYNKYSLLLTKYTDKQGSRPCLMNDKRSSCRSGIASASIGCLPWGAVRGWRAGGMLGEYLAVAG
jgi:hypothetical protein